MHAGSVRLLFKPDKCNELLLPELNNLFIFTYNTKNNLESLISMWDSIIKYKSLSICFVNQESKLEKRWIIHPYTHNKISERSALKQGLMSLFQTVETKH